MGFPCFSAIARSVMISAEFRQFCCIGLFWCFSAIARSVMISASELVAFFYIYSSFSAIARSVMISAALDVLNGRDCTVSVL